MASYLARTQKHTRKNSWWDSHVNPKNSKWLTDNLEEMDHSVKRMLKLIEEDADSFAKKAEMYYQKRPELISLVEEFYRMYRSLAERYDHVTGELKKNMPSDLQSQSSGISDVGSELPTTWPSPEPRPAQRKSGQRAAGFEFFLGSGGSNAAEQFNKECDDSSTLDYESESDESSSVNNYQEDQGLRRRVMELEVELRDVKERFSEGSFGSSGDLLTKIAEYDDELSRAKEEISRLKTELRKSGSVSFNVEEKVDFSDPEEDLKTTKEKLKCSEKEVANLKLEFENNIALWKEKADKEKRDVVKLEDRIGRYKASLADREREIRGLKETVMNANMSLSEENLQLQTDNSKLLKERAYLEDNLKEWELRCQSLEEETRRVKSEKIEMEELLRAEIEELNKNLETLNQKTDMLTAERDDLTAEISCRDDRIDEMNKHLQQLNVEQVELIGGIKEAREMAEELKSRVKELETEVEKHKEMIEAGAEEKREAIRQLCFSLEHYRNGYHRLVKAFVENKNV